MLPLQAILLRGVFRASLIITYFLLLSFYVLMTLSYFGLWYSPSSDHTLNPKKLVSEKKIWY